jgi:hypothetical protein
MEGSSSDRKILYENILNNHDMYMNSNSSKVEDLEF